MSYTGNTNDLSVMTATAVATVKTLWDNLPKLSSDTPSFIYTKRDLTDRDNPDIYSAVGSEPSIRTSHFTAVPGITTQWHAATEIKAMQKGTLGSNLSREQAYLTKKVKEDILKKCEGALYTKYGTLSTSSTHSSADWKSTTTNSLDYFVADIDKYKNAMFATLGVQPNVLMINQKGYNALNAGFLKSGNYLGIDYTNIIKSGQVTDNLDSIMGLKLWVVDVTTNTSGAYASLWGNYAWLMYIDTNPSMLTETPSLGFVVESGANGTSTPWYTKEIQETEKGSNWYLETFYQSAFVETNSNAIIRIDSSGSGDLY